MSTPSDTPPPRLALLALDLTGGDAEAVAALLTRLAQVTRHRLHTDCGVTVGEARTAVISAMSLDDFIAAFQPLGAP